MKIGLDFDDVITEFTDSLMKFYHKKYGKKVIKDQIKQWNWGLYWGISREEATRRVDEFHETHKVEDILPLDKAIDSINELMERHDVLIITGKPVRFKHRVEEWLQHYLGKKLEVIHAGEWHKGQAATKAEICKELGVKVLLEDSGETALDCANSGIKVLLFDKPWNKQFKHKNIQRVKNWEEAIKDINEIH